MVSHLSVVELSVHIDLSLSDVSREVRDGVSDVWGGRDRGRGRGGAMGGA